MGRKKYSPEIKQAAINDYFNGIPIENICEDYGIKSKHNVRRWAYTAQKQEPKLSLLQRHVFHDQSEKDAVIQYYFFGDNGFFPSQRDLANRFNIPLKTVDYWIQEARKKNAALPKRHNTQDESFKENVINTYFSEDVTITDVAERFGLSISTVGGWIIKARKDNPRLSKKMRYSNETIEQSISAYINGESLDVICEKYGVDSSTTIQGWVKSARKLNPDLPKRMKKYSDELKERAISAYLNGESFKAICEKYGIASISTVKYWVTEARKIDQSIPRNKKRYDSEVKRKAVADYFNNVHIDMICENYGIASVDTVRPWIYKARKHNPDLSKRRNKYSDEVKKQAISMYLDGEAKEVICQKFGIKSIQTVRYWVYEARKLNPSLPTRTPKNADSKIR